MGNTQGSDAWSREKNKSTVGEINQPLKRNERSNAWSREENESTF
jgi:hypothetical protein